MTHTPTQTQSPIQMQTISRLAALLLLALGAVSGWTGTLMAQTGGTPAMKAAADPAGDAPFRVEEASIAATLEAIRTHRVTCRQIVERYIARIQAYDQTLQQVASLPGQRVRLNSIILINPQALADADRLDAEFQRTGTLRPLHGIPVIVKDNYDTAGLQTTAGSLAMKGNLPETDAFMVKRLREAGAIVLAKSNMAEWAFSPYLTESSIAGITRNPYALDRVPAGSSGGTAAAVATSLGLVGLGTDTGNSIRGPSSHNDLVGIRPTIGLTSRDGIVPLNFNNDVGGPMARSVADAAAVLSVVAGYDPADPITKMSEGHAEADYTKFLDRNGLKGARIGVFRRYVDKATTDPQIKALTEQAVADLRAQGATVVDSFDLPDYDELTKPLYCGDFQTDVNAYLARHGQNAPYTSLADIVASGLYLPYIENQMKGAVAATDEKPKAAAKADSKTDAKAAARAERRGACGDVYHDEPKIVFRSALLAAMEKEHLDAIVYPTWSNSPRKVGEMKSPAGDNSQVLSPQTGFPAITVPMGFTKQEGDAMLPAGLTFLGRTFSEPLLIRLAYAYEQATHHRRPPPGFGLLP
jgi:Asp-tRNA(Asn)/Glu-tRNA(Gln) amidotransferase A subunit family amidase